MPRIDTSKIENYESMTAEEKLVALEAFDLPEPDMSGYVRKDLYDKASSEAAKFKKQLNEKLTEEEVKERERAEQQAEKDNELNALRKEIAVSKYKAKYIALGYDEKTADEAANAAYDGDFDKVFELQSKNIEAVRKSAESEAMKKTPAPRSGGDGEEKMTLAEAMEYKNEHPEANVNDLI